MTKLRAMVFSHRDWIETNNRRELHRHALERHALAAESPAHPGQRRLQRHQPLLAAARLRLVGNQQ